MLPWLAARTEKVRIGMSITNTPFRGPGVFAAERATIEGLDKAGRGRGEVERMIEVKLSWDPDPEKALENTRFWAPLSLVHGPGHDQERFLATFAEQVLPGLRELPPATR